MSAPPARENLRAFVDARERIAAAELPAPEILAVDYERGFLLESDLGDDDYARAVARGEDPEPLYRAAVDALAQMQLRSPAAGLPAYDEAALRAETDLFPEWYCAQRLQKPLTADERATFAAARAAICAAAAGLPRVFTHRDYHSRNLMLLRAGAAPGILDFQDAVAGPALYDAASLLRDAYIEWGADFQDRHLRRYWRRARSAGVDLPRDYAAARRDFNLLSAQRGLKVLGIFARLFHRDGKDRYLRDLPIAHRHLLAALSEISEMQADGGGAWIGDLRALIESRPPPAID